MYNLSVYIVEIVLLAYFFPLVIFNFVFGFASVFKLKSKTSKQASGHSRIAVLIPGYKEDAVIVSVAEQALNQSYPQENYSVVIIADSFQESTLEQLRQLPIKVVEVAFENSTKSKALNKAMDVLGDEYDLAVLLDADNVMEKHFLEKVNNSFQSGFINMQGRRVAKNEGGDYSFLDGVSEAINNNIFRKGHNLLGFSSSFIGSGMALPYASFKEKMKRVNAIGGFDRALQVEFIDEGQKIYYLEDALVYDEKIGSAEGFGKQRTRWLSSQYVYLRKNLWRGVRGLMTGKVDLFNASILHNLFLPRVLNLGFLVVYVFTYILLDRYLAIDTIYVASLALLYYLATFLAIPKRYRSWKVFVALKTVPQTFFIMLKSLFGLKGANKKFIHTEHTSIEIEGKKES